MDEPERLLSGAGSDLERELLSAAREEQPSARSMQRTAIALAAATGASTFTKSLWAARELLQPFAAKVAATSVLVGSTAYVVATQLDSMPEPPQSPSAQHSGAPATASPASAALPGSELPTTDQHRAPAADRPTDEQTVRLEDLEEAPAAVAPATNRDEQPRGSRVVAKAATSSADAKGSSGPSIADEVKALDSARRSLDGGRPSTALRQLDAYARTHKGGSLGQEALVMRIRALVQSGRRSEALALAKRFRAESPSSPYNKRIDSVVGSSGNR